MGKRKKIIIIVVVAGVLLFAIGAGWYWLGSDKGPIQFIAPSFNEEEKQNDISVPVETVPVEQSQPQQFSAAVVARLFAERFGTFSNEDNFSGIELVRPYISSSFETWFDSAYKNKLREDYPSGDYMGETVKVLEVIMESETSNDATALVRTQRTVRMNGTDKTSYQTLRLEMVKNAGVWLIDGAYWENI